MNNGAKPGGEVIVGLLNDMAVRHGYVVDHGTFQSYDVQSPTIKLTAIWDMNPRGQFVGTYVDATGRHGFVQNPDGSAPIQIDVPGQTNTIVFGIDPNGMIVGSYSIGSATHGFVAVPTPEGNSMTSGDRSVFGTAYTPGSRRRRGAVASEGAFR